MSSFWLLSDFFRRSAVHKQRVDKKQNIETDSATTIGDKEKLTYFMYVEWKRNLVAHGNAREEK